MKTINSFRACADSRHERMGVGNDVEYIQTES